MPMQTSRRTCFLQNVLWALLATSSSVSIVEAVEYGVDCSFPIHNKTLSCGDLLGDRQTLYENYMEGCRKYYSAEQCDAGEDERIAMNRRQPQSMVNFTSTGFRKIKAPESLRALLDEFWSKNKDKRSPEYWPRGNIYTNHWESPTYMISVEDENLEGGGEELRSAIWKAAEDAIADWTTMKLRPSSLYGIRVYTSGSVLNPHVDRLPLVSSAIVNVAQDVDEPWPIEVYDRFDNAVNITMEPGDMVLYESASLTHGRPFPLQGRFYANVFIHFEPIDHRNGDQNFSGEEGLPPYVVPNSPEAANWFNEHTNGWSKGEVEELKEIGLKDPQLLHFKDENGWQPVHEAVRYGRLGALQFLVEQGADINARTGGGQGASVLRLAKDFLQDPEDPVLELLYKLGAEDWEDEGLFENEEDEFGYDYDYYWEEYYYEEDDPGSSFDGQETMNNDEEKTTANSRIVSGEL